MHPEQCVVSQISQRDKAFQATKMLQSVKPAAFLCKTYLSEKDY